MYGHDDSNTRTNIGESALDATTVGELALDWRLDDLVGVTGTPMLVDGVAYFGDWMGAIRAVDAETGEEIWSYSIGGFVVGAPAVDGDGVYASSGRRLVRLDRATGEERWSVDTHDHPQAQINASPVVVDDVVIQGVASFENIVSKEDYSFRGAIAAFDTASGAEVWRFYTTADDETAGPGAGIWSTPAIDRDRGVLYVGTGQSLAEPTAPLTDSILAIDYTTGRLEWSTAVHLPGRVQRGQPHREGRRRRRLAEPLELRRAGSGGSRRQGRHLPCPRSRDR